MKNRGDSSHSGQDSGGSWERLTQQATRSEDTQQRGLLNALQPETM